MILLTGLYETGDVKRDGELEFCYRTNMAIGVFENIYFFLEEPSKRLEELVSALYRHERISVLISHAGRYGRMTFQDYFKFAGDHLDVAFGEKARLCCIANSDIHFDSSIALVKPEHLDNTFMCLSRWRENQPDEAARDGHDAWIFKTPVKIPEGCDFTLGSIAQDPVLGVAANDVCIAGLMAEAGYKIVNPGLDVKAYHVHESNYRNYNVTDSLLFKPKRRVLRSHLEKINV